MEFVADNFTKMSKNMKILIVGSSGYLGGKRNFFKNKYNIYKFKSKKKKL